MHYASVEYGLISSCHLPSEKKFNFSLILDDIGAFFNTEHRSRLEMILDEGFGTETRALTDRARAFTDTVLKHNITKYNNAPNMLLAPRKKTEKGTERRRILVIDQTSGDLSIKYGQCEKYSFQDMLDHAMAQPDAEVFFKPHPETLAGAKGANFDIDVLRQREDLTVLEENCNIMSLMSQVDEVYVMVSGVGFEALMAGKTVRCFGVPFYAGRGLTIDMAEPARQRRPLSIEELVAGVYLKYHQFYDPDTRAPVTAEVCLDRLISKLPRKSGLIHDGTRSLQVDLTDPAEAEAYTEMLAGRIPPDVAAAAKLVALGDSIADVTDGSGFVSTCLADLGVYRIHAMSETDSTLDALTTLDHDVIRVHSDEGAVSCDETGNARVSKKTQSLGRLDHVLAGERLALLRVAPKKRAVDILKTAEGLMQDQPPAAILARLKPNELPSAAEFLSSWYGAPECLSTGKEQDGKTASLFLFQIKAPQGAEND
jgi:capsular polysaccharide export protein